MTVYRCDWCGRFYSSPLPEGSACPNHIRESNDRLMREIEKHNEKIRQWRDFDQAHGLRRTDGDV